MGNEQNISLPATCLRLSDLIRLTVFAPAQGSL